MRSREVIKKIKCWTAQEGPPKQRYMARLTRVSQPTVSCMVNEDLDRVDLKKPTAPKLTDAQVVQRKVRAKPFSLFVSGGREQYILTLDEAWISLDFTNSQSPIYYAEKTKSERIRAPPVATLTSILSENFVRRWFYMARPNRLVLHSSKHHGL